MPLLQSYVHKLDDCQRLVGLVLVSPDALAHQHKSDIEGAGYQVRAGRWWLSGGGARGVHASRVERMAPQPKPQALPSDLYCFHPAATTLCRSSRPRGTAHATGGLSPGPTPSIGANV